MKLSGSIALLAALTLTVASAFACQSTDSEATPEPGVGTTASAHIMSADGQSHGMVTLTQGPQGVVVAADLNGLPPGGHAFHIHSVGSCTPDFSAAGGHFGPGEESHGYLFSTDMHAGDLPNIYVNADGSVKADTFTNNITLAGDDDERSLFDDDGSAIIVHANPDDYGEDAGVAGPRIACGVIILN